MDCVTLHTVKGVEVETRHPQIVKVLRIVESIKPT
jgi:hypothetical protein